MVQTDQTTEAGAVVMTEGETHCVTCGGKLGPHPNNHHCDPRTLARVEAGRRSATTRRQPRTIDRRLWEAYCMAGDGSGVLPDYEKHPYGYY